MKRLPVKKLIMIKVSLLFSVKPLLDILNMNLVDKHEKYLGIPTIIWRSRKAVFMALKDRVWKNLQGWKEKLLSRSGKGGPNQVRDPRNPNQPHGFLKTSFWHYK